MKQNSKEIYILDTSALFSYIEDEEGSDIVENLLIEAENKKIVIWIAFVSLTEVFYITLRERGEAEAKKRLELIQSLSVAIEESNEDLNLRAARFKANNRISLADAYIAALCDKYSGILVHKDPEFKSISPAIKEHRLPYKEY